MLNTKDVCEKLNDLIQLDFDAIEAYDAAIERLDSEEYRMQLGAFRQDHQRHTVELSAKVRELGGTPATEADFMRVLTKGKVVIGGLAEDKGILMAMNANEALTNKSYESALEKLAGHTDTVAILRRNLDDERRHKHWIETALEALKNDDAHGHAPSVSRSSTTGRTTQPPR